MGCPMMLQESKRQLVALVFTVATVVALNVVGRFLDDPDGIRTAKMRAARAVSKTADRGALVLVNLADKAEAVYERERL